MRIVRLFKTFPRDDTPGPGLHPYYLSNLIQEPHLIITKKMSGRLLPTASHVSVKEVSYSDVAFFEALDEEKFNRGSLGFKLRKWWLLLKKLREGEFAVKALPAIVGFRPDIIHVHSYLYAPVAVAARKLLRGSKLVISLHNTTDFKLREMVPMIHYISSQADALFGVSEELVKNLHTAYPQKTVLHTPSCVDTNEFRDLGLQRQPQVLTVARFVWQKRPMDILTAFKHIRQKSPELRLKAVGEGPLRPDFEEAVRRCGLSHCVDLIPKLSRVDLMQELNRSKLFMLASAYEGLPKAALEALATGTPVVLTTGCCAGNIIKDCGEEIPVGQPEALAAAVMGIINDRLKWENYSRQARDVAVRYDWSRLANSVSNCYRDILSV